MLVFNAVLCETIVSYYFDIFSLLSLKPCLY